MILTSRQPASPSWMHGQMRPTDSRHGSSRAHDILAAEISIRFPGVVRPPEVGYRKRFRKFGSTRLALADLVRPGKTLDF